jgi:hypothetical protein
MSSISDPADLLKLAPETRLGRRLHDPGRIWPETNCYIDVWVELLPALGCEAEAALAFAVRQDFEGDQFTFFKFPPEDLQALFGLAVQELAIYDTLEGHTLEQLRRGRPVLIEVDSHWLADTADYRRNHVKTTIAAVALDPGARTLGYFHNTAYHVASGDDFEALFRKPAAPDTLFPYVEFVKREGEALEGTALVQASLRLLRRHLGQRPLRNPIGAWREALPGHVEKLAARDMAFFHLYAFNLPRQLGANFEMLASYLDWLIAEGEGGLEAAMAAARRIAEGAKAAQFQLARMAHRRKFDATALALDALEADYTLVLSTLAGRYS